MEIDLAHAGAASDLTQPALPTPFCVIGGGIAGLLLAHALVEAGLEVLLLEAGGKTPEAAQERLASEVALPGRAHEGTRDGRIWALGGSSVTWGGQLLPLGTAVSWHVPLAELESHYATVEQLLGVDALPYEAEAFWAACKQTPPGLSGTVGGIRPLLTKFAPFHRRNLARSLGERLRTHPRARVVLHGRVTGLEWNRHGDRVEAVVIQPPHGGPLRVKAGICILAAGTVETCRLLLLSAPLSDAVRHNWKGQVGKNFHDHLTVQVAMASGAARERVVNEARPWLHGGVRGTAHSLKWEAGPELRHRLGLHPSLAHWTFTEPEGTGVAALRQMLRQRQQGQNVGPAAPSLPRMTGDLWNLFRDAHLNQRRYVSRSAQVALRINVAQQLPTRSAVRLSPELDTSGQPRAAVDWDVSPDDLRSVGRYAAYLQEELAASGLGEHEGLRWRRDVLACAENRGEGAPLDGLEDARHAMGGACMGRDASDSVVDASLRVHGVENLYVASAAVFPEGSPHLPTMTLMALTLRLARHLSKGRAH